MRIIEVFKRGQTPAINHRCARSSSGSMRHDHARTSAGKPVLPQLVHRSEQDSASRTHQILSNPTPSRATSNNSGSNQRANLTPSPNCYRATAVARRHSVRYSQIPMARAPLLLTNPPRVPCLAAFGRPRCLSHRPQWAFVRNPSQ